MSVGVLANAHDVKDAKGAVKASTMLAGNNLGMNSHSEKMLNITPSLNASARFRQTSVQNVGGARELYAGESKASHTPLNAACGSAKLAV